MEAARALARAGHPVSLFEAAERARRPVPDGVPDPGQGGLRADRSPTSRRSWRGWGSSSQLGRPVRDADAGRGLRRGGGGDRRPAPARVDLPGADLPHVLSPTPSCCGRRPRRWWASAWRSSARAGSVSMSRTSLTIATSLLRAYGLDPPGRPARMHPRAPASRTTITLMRRAGPGRRRIGPSTRWVVVQELQRWPASRC